MGSENLEAETTNGGIAAQTPLSVAALRRTGPRERFVFVVDIAANPETWLQLIQVELQRHPSFSL